MRPMRSTALVGVTLTLLMLLLVSAAAFIFLFQGRTALEARNQQLEQAVVRAETQVDAAQSTRDALAAALATAEADSVLLEGQLVESQQEADDLTAQLAESDAALAELQQEQQALLQNAPQLEIVAPKANATLLAGESVDVAVAAADPTGVTAITITIDEETVGNYVVPKLPLVTVMETWTPVGSGQYEMLVTAENGRSRATVTMTLSVVAPASALSTITVDPNAMLRARIEESVTEVRGLMPLTPVTTTVLTTPELMQRAVTTPTTATLMREAAVWQAFDFIAPDFDYAAAVGSANVPVQTSFYDAGRDEMLVAGDVMALAPAQQLAYAHEFTRLLQDQHFGLDRLANGRLPSDAQLAQAAFTAGDVGLVQNLFLRSDFFSEAALSDLLATLGEQPVAPETPAVLAAIDSFRSEAGLTFVEALYQENGFTAVDAAWNDRPQSTEQILQPEKYETGDAPMPVTLPQPLTTLSDGWTPVAENTLGAFLLRTYLAQQLNANQVETAAAGWGGDRYAVYERPSDGALLLVWRLAWDTLDDSVEFAALYPNYPTRLFGVSGEIQPDSSECWQGDEATICLVQQEDETVIIRAPDLETATAVAAELTQSQ